MSPAPADQLGVVRLHADFSYKNTEHAVLGALGGPP